MKFIKNSIPNLLTLGNLSSGVIGIAFAFSKQFEVVSYLVLLALVFDFMDGFVARMLKVSSPMGKELDSLADLVTFGVLPGVLIFNMLCEYSLTAFESAYVFSWVQMKVPIVFFIPLIVVPALSALRLAKFNIDETQSDSFSGLPTPANAVFIASYPLIMSYGGDSLKPYIIAPYFLIISSVLMAILLVVPVRLMALKFKNFGWKDNVFKYIFIVLIILSVILLGTTSIPVIILLYILISITESLMTKKVINEE